MSAWTPKASSFIAGPNQPAAPRGNLVPVAQAAGNPLQKTPIVVSESTNTLLVKATPEQHARIAAIVQYIDRYTPEEQWIYQVYPLESSSPDHLASLLERLIQETTKDKDGKIEKVTPKTAGTNHHRARSEHVLADRLRQPEEPESGSRA